MLSSAAGTCGHILQFRKLTRCLWQNCVRRLSRLDHELEHGESKRLCDSSKVRTSPYKSQVDWLMQSDCPVLIESSPRCATRLPDTATTRSRVDVPMSPTWTPEVSGHAALFRSWELPTLPMAQLQEATNMADYDSFSAASTSVMASPLGSPILLSPANERRASMLIVS